MNSSSINTYNSYNRIATTYDPLLLIILIDNSLSMNELNEDSINKGRIAADYANRIVNAFIHRHYPHNRCYFEIAAYNDKIRALCSGNLCELREKPLRLEKGIDHISDGEGGLVEVETVKPIWIEYHRSFSQGSLALGLSHAATSIVSWQVNHINSPAPIVINITDGKNVTPTSYSKDMAAFKKLTQISINDGAPLLYNLLVRALPGKEKEDLNNTPLSTLTSNIPLSYIDELRRADADYFQFDNESSRRGCFTDVRDVIAVALASSLPCE